MFSIKTIALCIAVVLATTSHNVHAATNTRYLRAQHQSDTPHTHADANGATTTNINFTPGTVNTNVNITPGTSTTTVQVPVPAPAAPAPPPPAPAPAPQPVAYTPAAVRPAPAAQPPSGGGGGLLGGLMGGGGNPLTGVATMAHEAHGALLGHTGTVPSSYMQGQSGGGHGH